MDRKQKQYTCDRCCSGFTTNYKHCLVRHIKRIHEGVVKTVKGGLHKCQEDSCCTYQTTNKRNLRRHIDAKHRNKRLRKCNYCDFLTTSKERLINHKKTHKNEVLARRNCSVCNVSFHDLASFENHLNEKHPAEQSFQLIESAFQKSLRIYSRNIRIKAADTTCLWSVFDSFKSLCRRITAKDFPVYKLNLSMFGVFEKASPDDEDQETEVFVLKSTHFIIKPYTKLKKTWATIIKQFDDRIENLLMKGSGYTLTEVLKIHVEIAKSKPLKFSCQDPQFRADIATESVVGKKHLVNVQNSKYNCFLTCLAFHWLQNKYPNNPMNDASEKEMFYDSFVSSLDFTNTGIYKPYKKPVGIKQMKKLLKLNKELLGNLQVNIFGLLSMDTQKIYAYEIGMGKRESENVLNLLSIPLENVNATKECGKAKTQQHLVVIKDLNTFMYQKTGAKGKNRTRRRLCMKCLTFFKDDNFLRRHKLACNNPRGNRLKQLAIISIFDISFP